jgi:hypothetical protein
MSVLFPDIAIIGVLTSLLDLTKKRNWQPTFLITMT